MNMFDITGRQSEETKLRESLEDLKETIKSTYQRKVHERVQGGVSGAGHFGSSFFGTLGLTGLADSIKKKAEAKELNRQEKEAYVQKFQEGNETFTGSTARGIAETEFDAKKASPAAEEAAIEQKEFQTEGLEVQKKSGEDLTALYTISDDYFKAQMKYNDEVKKLFEKIADGVEGGGGGGLLSTAADLAGDLAGNGKGKAGKAAGTAGKAAGGAGKLGKLAMLGRGAAVGGGLLAVGSAAYEGYNEYQAADDKVKSGELTAQEGQVEKGKAVGGGVGGAAGGAGGAWGGAAAGAALGTMIFPGVGTVVGGALGGLVGGAAGYWGGKKAGQAVGGAGVEGYQALTPSGAPAAAASPAEVQRGRPTMANDPRLAAAQTPSRSSALAGAAIAASVAVTPAVAAQKIPESVPAKPAAVAPVANAAAPQGEYDNRSALTGFTKEFLQGIVDGSISGPINKQQAQDYLDKIQPGELGYKKRFMRGKPVAMPSEPLAAEPITPSSGSSVSSASSEVSAAKESSGSSAGPTNNVVSAPVTNVVNNTTTSSDKGSKNNDSTFQKFVDRRYYPTF